MKQSEQAKNRKKINIPLVPLAVVLMFIFGVSVFLYPTISNYLATKTASKVTGEYAAEIAKLDDEAVELEMQKAIVHNEALAGNPVRDPFVEGSGMVLPQDYMNVLNVNGLMCTVEIPCINVNLPVYHGTSEAVLEKAIGHLMQTALPIGGEGCHPVLTGHTGLATAKLFTDLNKLVNGDIFIIRVLNSTLYYEVDDISIILPEELSKLNPVAGKDYLTLLTCTPYGVNSHRLLVRGVRLYPSEEEINNITNIQKTIWSTMWEYKEIIIVILFVLILIAVWLIYILGKNKRKEPKEQEDNV